MSCRPNVLSAKCLSVKGPVGQTSVGLVSVGQTSAATRKHPLHSQSLEPWYGWVGGCCITRESKIENAAAVKAMEYFEALCVERWLQGKVLRR